MICDDDEIRAHPIKASFWWRLFDSQLNENWSSSLLVVHLTHASKLVVFRKNI